MARLVLSVAAVVLPLVAGLRRSSRRGEGRGALVCEHQKDCARSAWCNDTTHEEYCGINGQAGHCPTPQCKEVFGCPVWNCGGGSCPNTLFNCGRNGLIALTFDDGITAATEVLTEKLYAAGIKATFFINGDSVSPRTWSVMGTLYEHGHQVSSHTRSHCNMVGGAVGEPCDSVGGWKKDLDDLVADVHTNGQEIRGAANQGGWYWLRPPYLDVDPATAEEIGVAGYGVAWASDSANDWNGDNEPSKNCLLDIVNHSSAGSSHVMLQHDWAAGWQIPADWWLDLKARADANGWQFVTIDECAAGTPKPN